LRGTIKVKSENTGGEIEVLTAISTTKSQGADFTVSVAPGGEVLITCSSGRVESATSPEKVLIAVPGIIIEQLLKERSRTISVPPKALDQYVSEWDTLKKEGLHLNVDDMIKLYAKRYLEEKSAFEDAFQELLSKQRIINRWEEQDRTRRPGSSVETEQEMREISGVLQVATDAVLPFEWSFYRLLEIKPYHELETGKDATVDARQGVQLFRAFRNDARELMRRINFVHFVSKMYSFREHSAAM
jgi:hypothetical protein